ncbi:MAG: hypothetical protein R3301_19820 [Saprospiraceae bacterium]|nr:hypothetical protein [Saprospiraceae bacterium]
MKHCWLILLLTTGLWTSCTRVAFEAPQPLNAKALASFPSDLLGAYALADTPADTVGFILPDAIVAIETTSHYLHQDQLDTMPHLTLQNDRMYDDQLPGNRGFPVTYEGDSLRYTSIEMDTIGISDTLLIKGFGDYLILNTRFEDEYWDIYLLKPGANGSLETYAVGNYRPHTDTASTSDYDGDISTFLDITPFRQLDESTYLVNPSRKALKQLVKAGFFLRQETFVKIGRS